MNCDVYHSKYRIGISKVVSMLCSQSYECPHLHTSSDHGEVWCEDCMTVVGCDHESMVRLGKKDCPNCGCILNDTKSHIIEQSTTLTPLIIGSKTQSYFFTPLKKLLDSQIGKNVTKWNGVVEKSASHFNRVQAHYSTLEPATKLNLGGIFVCCLEIACIEYGRDLTCDEICGVIGTGTKIVNIERKKMIHVLGDEWSIIYPHQKIRSYFNKFREIFFPLSQDKLEKVVQLLQHLEKYHIYFLSQQLPTVCSAFFYFSLSRFDLLPVEVNISHIEKRWKEIATVSLDTTKKHCYDHITKIFDQLISEE